MNSVFSAVSIQSVDSMTHLQQREISAPLFYALKNSEEDEKRLENRLQRVNETEEADELALDPDGRRQQEQQKKKKKEEEKRKNRGLENGRFIDFSA